MKDYPSILLSKKNNLLLFVFIVGFLFRLFLIHYHRGQNDNIDLSIYRETGQLVNHGVNPYDFSDGTAIRNQLRLDSIAFDSYVSGDQGLWDYYISSNLPLSTLYYGLIDRISDNPKVFRIVFSFFDTILAMLIALILFQFWHLKKNWLNLIMLISVSALSPVMLFIGNVIPEDKSLQTLLMLAAVYFAKEKKWILSSILLGLSVAFKGLGVFIYPLAVYFAIGEPENIFRLSSSQLKRGIIYTLLALFSTIIWFIPYMPYIYDMMQARLMSNMGAAVEPGHASVWSGIFRAFPEHWRTIKNITVIIFSILWFYFFVIRKINIAAISLYLLVLFVDVMLLQGSLDRMNIGITVSLILFCFIDLKYTKVLAWYTILIGWLLYFNYIFIGSVSEDTDMLYSSGFLVLFLIYPAYRIIAGNSGYKKSNEA